MPDPGCAEADCARAWPFEVVYNATGYGDYPFWTGDALPGHQSGLATSSSGAHIHTTWSAVVNAEKLEHGSCSLSSINAGFPADGPCTHLMLGTQYAYLYDQEETHCCISSKPDYDCSACQTSACFPRHSRLTVSVPIPMCP